MKKSTACVILLLLSAVLVSCGGGGGGGSESPYVGIRTQAVVADNNYDTVSRQAFDGVDLGMSSAMPMGSAGGDTGPASLPKPVSLALTLRSAAEQVLLGKVAGKTAAPRTVVSDSGTELDGYGGFMDYLLSVEDTTGNFWGTFTFRGWHGEGGAIITGPVNVSGRMDLSAFPSISLVSIRYSFRAVTVADGLLSIRILGTVALNISGPTATVTENLFLTNVASGETFWIDDFVLALTDNGSSVAVSIDGRIYLPDFGYVDISTATPFVYSMTSTFPSTGVLRIFGRDGAVVRLTVNSTTEYTVALDEAPGDGLYEHSVTVSWI
ncbi:MAG: hypothetical protein WC899_04520 [bacterium]|jgi:hypothetical protein